MGLGAEGGTWGVPGALQGAEPGALKGTSPMPAPSLQGKPGLPRDAVALEVMLLEPGGSL